MGVAGSSFPPGMSGRSRRAQWREPPHSLEEIDALGCIRFVCPVVWVR